ncbi:hypothetical protein [Nocardioides sp.]|uniref:hypothetical protein n=1 Tax=Nocardioides sp. TaxID=35761 RepID=UPI003526CDF7
MTPPRRTALVVAALLAAVSLVALTPGQAAADGPRTGYRLRADGTAAGGWFGSRTASHRAVYRIDPAARPRTGGFRDGHWASTLRGSGPVTVDRSRVRRAAWLVAKYGTYDSDAQAAAVEAALDHLLHGGRYRLTGRGTERRLRQTGRATRSSGWRATCSTPRELAGPYRVRVTTTGAVLGGSVQVQVRVTTQSTGQPVAHLPVRIGFDGRTLAGTTDADGTVVETAAARVAGPRPVVVQVQRVPSDRLFVRRPVRPGGSRVVVAGRKIVLTARSRVAVQATPRAWVTTPDQRTTSSPVPGVTHLADGYASPRVATLRLHGPFAPGEQPTCDTASEVARVTEQVAADGSYPVPETRVDVAGVYRWSVRVPADAYNVAAGGCGQSVLLKAVPTLSVRPTKTPVARGQAVFARVAAAGLPPTFSRDAIARLYGPFASRDAVRCTTAKQARWRSVTLTGPSSSVRTDSVSLGQKGFYGWRAVLPGTPLTTKVSTRCGASGTILRIQ